MTPFADHLRFGAQGLGQRGNRVFGLGFLKIADNRVDQHHAENRQRIGRPFDKSGRHPGRQQDIDQRVMKLQQKAQQRAFALARREPIGPVLQAPRLDLLAA